jgi:hypothetical protein
VPRVATLLAVLLFAFPGAAFAQGAGDDQYQDPFGDEPSQSDGSGSGDASDGGGLSDSPPTVDSGSGSGSGSGADGGTTQTPDTGTPATQATANGSGALPRTGSEPAMLGLVGALFLLTGLGLRLRTIDPDAF